MNGVTTAPAWRWHAFDALPPQLLYDILRLRSEIFVVEQNCVFLDMDGLDATSLHLSGHDASGTLIAALRLVPPGVKRREPALGRVVVARSARGRGLGRLLMREGIVHCERLYPDAEIFVAAQQHLEPFYNSLGFRRTGTPYLEDGIPHIDMLRSV